MKADLKTGFVKTKEQISGKTDINISVIIKKIKPTDAEFSPTLYFQLKPKQSYEKTPSSWFLFLTNPKMKSLFYRVKN